MWPVLYLPKGEYRHHRLPYRTTNLADLIRELAADHFSGYLEILAPHERGLMIFYEGRIYNCFYEGTEELQLTREEIVLHFLRTETRERETFIDVVELSPRIIVALSALDAHRPLHRELETFFLEMDKLFETLGRKRFSGALRFYRIRSNTRLGSLLVRMNKITTDQLREAIRQQFASEGGLRLGDALVKIKAISAAELEDALLRQSTTRKGSDIEIAIALFAEGKFLGGYTQINEALVMEQDKVLHWISTSEVFMDIVEGRLPTPVNLQVDLMAPVHPAADTAPKPGAAAPVLNADAKEDTLVLSPNAGLEELGHPSDRVFAGNPPELQPLVSPAPLIPPEAVLPIENPGAPSGPLLASLPPLPAMPAAVEVPAAAIEEFAPEPLKGIDGVRAVAEFYMGFLGRSLFDLEKKKVEIPGRPLDDEQTQLVIQRLFHSACLIAGEPMATKMYRDIQKRLE